MPDNLLINKLKLKQVQHSTSGFLQREIKEINDFVLGKTMRTCLFSTRTILPHSAEKRDLVRRVETTTGALVLINCCTQPKAMFNVL